MKNKKLALALATIISVNSTAFAASDLARSSDKLNQAIQQGQINPEALESLLTKSEKETIADLKMVLAQVENLKTSLVQIQSDNSKDLVLKYANQAQVILVAASAMALKSHMKQSEKSNLALKLAAASALLNSFIRHYQEIKNLKPDQMGLFISQFNQEMKTSGILSSEIIEMSNELGEISNRLIQEKSQLDVIISKLGGGSDIATAAIILLAVTHWVSPKLAKEADSVLKELSHKLAHGGAAAAQNSKTVGAAGAVAGLPDLVGITLGLDSANSQEIVAVTINNLTKAANKLKMEIAQKEREAN